MHSAMSPEPSMRTPGSPAAPCARQSCTRTAPTSFLSVIPGPSFGDGLVAPNARRRCSTTVRLAPRLRTWTVPLTCTFALASPTIATERFATAKPE
jgi:hypothetical protein